MWCIPRYAEYVARIEDVLDLYAEEPASKRPVVCFDQTPRSLSARCASRSRPSRDNWSASTANTANGTANLFVFLDAHRPWRKVKVTDRRAAEDFAECMRELSDVHFPKAEKIRVVLDNLSTHSPSALYQTFPPSEARRILRLMCKSSITHPGTRAGSTWSKSKSQFCEASASTGALIAPNSSALPQAARLERTNQTKDNAGLPHQMDVHNRKGPRQNGPRLPNTIQRVIISVQRY